MTRKPGRQTFTLAGRGVLSNFVSGSLAQAEAFEAEEPPQAVGGDTRWLPVSDIYPGKFQPRQFFSEEAIEALATSFREQGFRGAINVRPLKNGTWEIVAGERRWRAAKLAGLTKVRCLVDQYTDEEALEFALIENLQREDLSKIEETEGILKLIEVKVGIPKERAITIIGAEGHPERIARSDVATSEDMKKILAVLSSFGVELQTFRTKNLRTLALPDDLKTAHLERGLSYSVALELLKIKDAAKRKALLEKAIKRKLSFREIRDRVKAATLVNTDEASPATRVGDTALVKRLTGLAKRLKSGLNLPEKSPKRRQLERLLGELETLFEESVATSLRD